MLAGRTNHAVTAVPASDSRDAASANRDVRFARALVATVVLATAIRLLYVLTDDRPFVGGDGFASSLEAHRFADGLGYTSAMGEVGAPWRITRRVG